MAIVFNEPKKLLADAAKISITGVLLGAGRVIIHFDWQDAAGHVLKSDSKTLTGADADQVRTATIAAGQVGQTYLSVIHRGAETKLKNMLGIPATIQ